MTAKRERVENRDQGSDYVDNKLFLDALRARKREIDDLLDIDPEMSHQERKDVLRGLKQEGKQLPPASNFIGQCFLSIAMNRTRERRFYSIADKEELVGYGIEDCVKSVDSFDTTRDNPFAYFSQCVYWAFLRKINMDNLESNGRTKLANHSGHDLDAYHVDDHDLGTHFFDATIDNN